MHGMMLPSGNDAAQSLAIYFGNLMQILENKLPNNSSQNIDANIYEDESAEDIDLVAITVH